MSFKKPEPLLSSDKTKKDSSDGKAKPKTLVAAKPKTISKQQFQKSHSEMDMKDVRRTVKRINATTKENVKKNTAAGSTSCSLYDPVVEDPKLARYRIALAFIHNAWRKRRAEVANLTEALEESKKFNTKSKNQLHVMNVLYNVEKKSNLELYDKCKVTSEENKSLQESVEHLKEEMDYSDAVRRDAQNQLRENIQELTTLTAFFKQTKTELLRQTTELNDLKATLKKKNLEFGRLENTQLELIKINRAMVENIANEKKNFELQMASKEAEMVLMRNTIKDLELDLARIRETSETQLTKYCSNEIKLKNELVALESQMMTLQHCLAGTMGERFKKCWRNSVHFQRCSLTVIHWFIAALLPAMQPPSDRMPFQVNFGRMMNKMRKR